MKNITSIADIVERKSTVGKHGVYDYAYLYKNYELQYILSGFKTLHIRGMVRGYHKGSVNFRNVTFNTAEEAHLFMINFVNKLPYKHHCKIRFYRDKLPANSKKKGRTLYHIPANPSWDIINRVALLAYNSDTSTDVIAVIMGSTVDPIFANDVKGLGIILLTIKMSNSVAEMVLEHRPELIKNNLLADAYSLWQNSEYNEAVLELISVIAEC